MSHSKRSIFWLTYSTVSQSQPDLLLPDIVRVRWDQENPQTVHLAYQFSWNNSPMALPLSKTRWAALFLLHCYFSGHISHFFGLSANPGNT